MFDKYQFFKDSGYEPHPKQLQIHKSNARFRLICAGRRGGKSKFAGMEISAKMVEKKEQLFWVVAPSYELSEKVFREIYWCFHRNHPELIKKSSITKGNMIVELINGSKCLGKSADNPESLIGEGVHGLVIDECAKVKEIVWIEALRPTLADFKGWGIFITTPRGRNWFFNEYTRGEDKDELDIESFHFPTYSNPYIDQEEIDEAKRTTPERTFRQEWLAEFLSDAGAVFRGVNEIVDLSMKRLNGGDGSEVYEYYQPGVIYVGGVDLAKHVDFTVIMIFRTDNNKLVYFDRFNKIDWGLQKERMKNASRLYGNCKLLIDSTGVGDGIYDDCVRMGISVEGFKIGSNKGNLIDRGVIAVENKDVKIPEIPVLINELQIYEVTTSKAGNSQYNAPEGYHDDCVIAFCLSCMKLTRRINAAFGKVRPFGSENDNLIKQGEDGEHCFDVNKILARKKMKKWFV